MRFTDIKPAKVLAAMIRAQGVVRKAAKMLHTQPANILRIIEENPSIQEGLGQCHQELVDEALESARDLLKGRDRDITKFVLSSMGETRGFTNPKNKVELSGSKESPVNMQIDLSGLSDRELDALSKALGVQEDHEKGDKKES